MESLFIQISDEKWFCGPDGFVVQDEIYGKTYEHFSLPTYALKCYLCISENV